MKVYTVTSGVPQDFMIVHKPKFNVCFVTLYSFLNIYGPGEHSIQYWTFYKKA